MSCHGSYAAACCRLFMKEEVILWEKIFSGLE